LKEEAAMTTRPIALIALAALALPGCVMTTTESRSWDDPNGQTAYARHGMVSSVREVVQRQHGDPAAGAVAGAIIGGILGGALGGHTHYDRWGYAHSEPNGAGALVGAAGGAAIGAAASQGNGGNRWYEVTVRFDDGGYETFTYRDAPPFRQGDEVILGPRGLSPVQ
jgi:outer membrane lipoprotein SlyB